LKGSRAPPCALYDIEHTESVAPPPCSARWRIP
jgi:hypothetical protein